MGLLKKHRTVILQLLLICVALIIFQIAARLLPGVLGLLANIINYSLGVLLLGLIVIFLFLQIAQNFRFERSFTPEKLKIRRLPALKNYQILNPMEEAGIFYKVQLHTHSNLSYDSNVPPEQIIESYKNDGYSVLAITDHDKFSDFSKFSSNEILVLPGIEETVPILFWPIPLGKHLVIINPITKRPHSKTVQERLNQASDTEGLVFPAHLSWRGGAGTGRWYPDELFRLNNLQFIEIANPHSKDPLDLTIWHKIVISRGPNNPVWGIAVDDSHDGSSHRGWIMVKSQRLDLPTIITSLKKGAFYATNGPTALDIKVEGTQITVSSPDAEWIRFINAQNQVIMATRAQKAVYQSFGDEGFIRVEVTDNKNRTAWSQPMWLVTE